MSDVAIVDQAARRNAAVLLKRVAIGRISKDKCESGFLDLLSHTEDPVIYAMYRTVFDIGADSEQNLTGVFMRHSAMRHRLCRWILFLKTGLEYKWPRERMAPGLRDLYNATFFDKMFNLDDGINRSNKHLFSQGDYDVWPFLRKADFVAAARKRRPE